MLAISGRDEVLEVTTGVPQAMASSGGRPKPSISSVLFEPNWAGSTVKTGHQLPGSKAMPLPSTALFLPPGLDYVLQGTRFLHRSLR